MRETIQRSFNVLIRNIDNKIHNKIQEANKKTSVSIQNVDKKIQEANEKIVKNTKHINQVFNFFPTGKSHSFYCPVYFKVLDNN